MKTENFEFFNNQDFPWVEKLAASTAIIQEEMRLLGDGGYYLWPRENMVKRAWNLHPLLVPGTELDDKDVSCPKTLKLLKLIPGLRMAAFSKLLPGAEILPHWGYSAAVLRAHLALKIPKGATVDNCAIKISKTPRTWKEGEIFIFDDMYVHQAYNKLEEERVVLVIDFLRPWKHRTSAIGYLRQRTFPPKDYDRNYRKVVDEALAAGQVIKR
ncbi:MAG: aspartyl/asparaginyl beta-hydroxylase domain-containing protein [Planctomycetes bacterium]|nr:aspartyl/asparaginyl beta-hydroxylase domain-containing protein [Planctomycetota bacterium]